MPKRVVDGEALWRSRKRLRVPVRFRGEYSELLPLADINGPFECDPQVIWSQVYAPGRPEFTVEDVVEMLDHYEAAGMIRRYLFETKTLCIFVGDNKKGRLPGAAACAKRKDLLPRPEDIPMLTTQNLPLESILRKKCKAEFGQVERAKFYNREFKDAHERLGYAGMQTAFDNWLQTGYSGKYPMGAFLKSLVFEAPVRTISVASDDPTAPTPTPCLQAVEDAISARGPVFFNATQKAALAAAINLHGAEAVIAAFNDFYSHLPADRQSFAAYDFATQVNARVRALLNKQASTERTKQQGEEALRLRHEQIIREREAAKVDIPEEL